MLKKNLQEFNDLPAPQRWEFLIQHLHDTLAYAPEAWKLRLKFHNELCRHLQKTDWCLNPTLQKAAPLLKVWRTIRTEMLQEFPELQGMKTLQKDKIIAEDQAIPWIVWVHNMRSAHNFGSIIRTVDCMGWAEVWASGYTPKCEHKGVGEAAMGAEQWVPVKYFQNPEDVLNSIRLNNKTLMCLEICDDSIPLHQVFPLQTNGVLLLGNEELGVSQELLKNCEQVVEIPQFGRKASLNVANSFAMFAWESRRQFLPKK